MPTVELSAGTIEYSDTGGDGPVLVLVHGFLMSGTVWRKVLPGLTDYRCIVPTWPLGAHGIPMRPDADLSLVAMGDLIGEFLDALDLRGVTMVQNDWGGTQIALARGHAERIGRLVLSSCEAFSTYPPAPARSTVVAGRIPGGVRAMMWLLNTPIGRRGPGTWGWLSKRAVPREVIDAWFAPATTDPRIRRDIRKYVTSVPKRSVMLDLAQRAAAFTGPVLVVWAAEDRMFPTRLGRRLADSFADARFVEIDDSYTLLPEDQPEMFTDIVRTFLERTNSPARRLN